MYREGIIQPFVVYEKTQKYGSFFEEMLTLAHELGHVADAWQTEHRAGVDDEFSGEAGLPQEQVFKNYPPIPLRPFAIGVADYMYHGHPDMIGFGERYKTNPKIRDEPYQRLMDRYNRETLSRQYPNQKGIYPSFSTEKDAYIPDRYSSSIIKGVTGRDPFANVWSAIPSDAAAHPAQAGALMELNRRLGRDPLEGMDEWMRPSTGQRGVLGQPVPRVLSQNSVRNFYFTSQSVHNLLVNGFGRDQVNIRDLVLLPDPVGTVL